jgi:hypothetical protein
MNFSQKILAAVVIRCSLGKSMYPPNRKMTIAIANIDIAVMVVRTGYLLPRLVTANART